MNQTEITKDDDQTLAPETLLDKTLYHVLQLTSEERCRLLAAWEEWKNGRKESTG